MNGIEYQIDHASQRRTGTVFEQGRQKSVTRLDKNDARVTQTTSAYDAFGRLQAQADARSGPTTYTYHDDGQPHIVTTPDQSGPCYYPHTPACACFRDPVNATVTIITLRDNGVVTQESQRSISVAQHRN